MLNSQFSLHRRGLFLAGLATSKKSILKTLTAPTINLNSVWLSRFPGFSYGEEAGVVAPGWQGEGPPAVARMPWTLWLTFFARFRSQFFFLFFFCCSRVAIAIFCFIRTPGRTLYWTDRRMRSVVCIVLLTEEHRQRPPLCTHCSVLRNQPKCFLKKLYNLDETTVRWTGIPELAFHKCSRRVMTWGLLKPSSPGWW